MPDSPHIDSPSNPPTLDAKSPPLNPLPSPSSLAQSSNSQLAALLTDAFKEIESLRRELAAVKKRAEDAERRYHALSSVSDPKSAQADTARVIQEFEQRALDAEVARDEAESRKRILVETWYQLDRYLHTVEMRAADARAGFSKIVSDGGGQLILASIPLPGGVPLPMSYPTIGSMAPPVNHARTGHPASGRSSSHAHRSSQSQAFLPLSLPPHPNPNGSSRRPRDDSVDRSGYAESVPGQPPTKKLKGYGDDRRGRDERTSYSESSLAYLHQRHQPLPPQAIEARERIYQDRRVPQARMIVPPGGEAEYPNHRGRSRSRSRSSSHSSESSLSVDEMLLLATGEAANGNAAPGSPSQVGAHRAHRRRHHHSHKEDTSSQRYALATEQPLASQQHIHIQQLARPDSPSTPQQVVHNYRVRPPHASASVPLVAENHVSTMPAPCHVQTIQTHVFAPVVTGAPQKKNKFSASGGSIGNLGATSTSGTSSVDAPPPAPPAHVYPATNTQGQRICRQCGMPGRYKEGKCVEKWGPGPMGPGTVCDRCRKKMKRVERRGTLESQQLAAANSLNNITTLQQQQQQTQPAPPPPPRNVVLQQAQSLPPVTFDRSIHRTDTLVNTQQTQSHSGSVHHTYSQPDRVRDRDRDDSDARSALVAAVSGGGSRTSTPNPASSHPHSVKGSSGPISSSHSHSTTRPPPSPPPAIASINDELPVSNVGRGGSVSRTQSRSNSRNGRSAGYTNASGPSKRSPLGISGGASTSSSHNPSVSPSHMDIDADADGDADADAEAEVEAEIEGAVEAATQLEAEADPDDEILEAAGANDAKR
ncbi:hypothetical protein AX17_001969 [Amanita inopinata Kibby_2008]|nr:hypothetical protein AX17_001969 [Amanita inopinata Kibby_2008]